MTSVVTITPAFIIDRLDHIGQMLADALDLMDVSDIQRDRIRETY